jgi:hypothetical protein
MLKNLFDIIANFQNPRSLASRMRDARNRLFIAKLSELSPGARMLDVGGTTEYWDVIGKDRLPNIELLILNKRVPKHESATYRCVSGDATHMPQYTDDAFDVVFSNSVIEHVGDFEAQRQMAQEVQRVGKRYFLQTPNFWFPIEPHFLFPGFQWLPVSFRVFLVRHFNLGWVKKIPDPEKARELVLETRLLTKKELTKLFPKATIVTEKFCGLAKSHIVMCGWDNDEHL